MGDTATIGHQTIDRKVDRVAAVGIAFTFVAAAVFLVVDPVQQVERRSLAPRAAPAATVPETSASTRWPLTRVRLGEAPTNLATDGRHIAYSRLSAGGAMEVVARGLTAADDSVAYRTPTQAVLGPLAFARGTIAFEEIALADGVPQSISIRVIDLATRGERVVDRYAADRSYVSALVRTDGGRVFYVRQRTVSSGVTHDVLMAEVASARSSVVWRSVRPITALALYGEGMALTVQGEEGRSTALLLDLGSGEATPIEGFAYAYVQALGARGVVVTGSVTMAGIEQPESWLIAPEGARTRLGSGCADVTMSDRVIAMRCAGRLEVRDLSSGESLHDFAPALGGVAAFEGGALWTEDDELVVLDLRP